MLMKRFLRQFTGLLLLIFVSGGLSANAAVTIIGAQYTPDQMFPEWDCFWHDGNYPTSCQANNQGTTVRVFLKNTGALGVTVNDATLAGYSLQTVIKMSESGSINPDQQNSIYFYGSRTFPVGS